MTVSASARLGIAGVNTRSLATAAGGRLGIAGNIGSTLRPQLNAVTRPGPPGGMNSLGDRGSREAWTKAVYLLDYTYLVCPDRRGGMRLRPGPGQVAVERRFPLYLDSSAYRVFKGKGEPWDSAERYYQTIDLLKPDGVMARDVVGDQGASREGYLRMRADGYAGITVPVFQISEGFAWTKFAGNRKRERANYLADAAQQAIYLGRQVTSDPVLREYVEKSPLVALGGLAQSPCPPEVRYLYLAELCKAFPEAQFWALAQASAPVVNGLGREGLLDRVWLDGSWWIHHAACEQLAVLQDGELKSIKLAGTGAQTFFPLVQRMAANLVSLLSAYAGLWTFPGPAEVPTAMEDREAVLDLSQRTGLVQLDMLAQLGLT